MNVLKRVVVAVGVDLMGLSMYIGRCIVVMTLYAVEGIDFVDVVCYVGYALFVMMVVYVWNFGTCL